MAPPASRRFLRTDSSLSTRDVRQHLDVRGADGLGRDQEDEDLSRLAVGGFEVDAFLRNRARGQHPIHGLRLAVGDRHPVADTGGHHGLAAQDTVQDLPLAPEPMGGFQQIHQLDHHFALGLGPEAGVDRLGAEQLGERHGLSLGQQSESRQWLVTYGPLESSVKAFHPRRERWWRGIESASRTRRAASKFRRDRRQDIVTSACDWGSRVIVLDRRRPRRSP